MLKEHMHKLPQYVIEGLVRFLYHQRIMRLDDKTEFGLGLPDQTAITAYQGEREQMLLLSQVQRCQDIGIVPIRREAHGDILRPCEDLELARERHFGISSCHQSAQGGAVVGQGQGWQRPLADDYWMHELN